MNKKNMKPCPWAKNDLDLQYHNEQWGVPLHDDASLFEMLILEGMQAGLSWTCILSKRQAMADAFDHFDVPLVAKYDEAKIETLLQNPNIIRNRAKLRALPKNARAFLSVQNEFGSFDSYIWSFVDHKPIINHWEHLEDVPAQTELSQKMSKDMKKRGFVFVGPTICYALMQSIGMVNDHLLNCPCHPSNQSE